MIVFCFIDFKFGWITKVAGMYWVLNFIFYLVWQYFMGLFDERFAVIIIINIILFSFVVESFDKTKDFLFCQTKVVTKFFADLFPSVLASLIIFAHTPLELVLHLLSAVVVLEQPLLKRAKQPFQSHSTSSRLFIKEILFNDVVGWYASNHNVTTLKYNYSTHIFLVYNI